MPGALQKLYKLDCATEIDRDLNRDPTRDLNKLIDAECVWYNDIQCPVRRQDAHVSAPEKANMERRRRKACLGLNFSVNSVTHPHVHFKKCQPCSQQLGINSDYCCAECQGTDWRARHRRFHGLMLFCSGEVNPAEGYPRPVEFRG